MSDGYDVVVCGSLVPDPLQSLQPLMGPNGPTLKNENMLPSVLDPWAAHALYEAAHLAKTVQGTNVWLVSLGPRARLQQLMMTTAQKVPFRLVALDGPAGAFTEPHDVAHALADAIAAIPGLDRSRLLIFGGCASATRDAGVTMQLVGEHLGITDQFLAVDELTVRDDRSFRVLERVEAGQYLASVCQGPPAVLAWATGRLPEPPNNPQIGMANMRAIMPALQQAKPVRLDSEALRFIDVTRPQERRETRIVRDASTDDVAREILQWING